MCMDFSPGLFKVTLRLRPGYVPRFYPNRFALRCYTSLFPSSSLCFRWGWKASYALSCRSLKIYVDRSSHWRKSPQLLVCFGAGSPWACHIEAQNFSLGESYEMRSLRSSLSVWAHSTRSMASSQPLFRGVLLEDICVAAGLGSWHGYGFPGFICLKQLCTLYSL